MAFERSAHQMRRGAHWLLNLDADHGSIASPPGWFGFTKYSGEWGFVGFRLGKREGGRIWIPGVKESSDAAIKAGRYGTWGEAKAAFSSSTSKVGWGKTLWRFGGRVGMPAVAAYSLATGSSVLDVARDAIMWRLLTPVAKAMFLNPVGAAITATIGVGVGVGMLYGAYRNDMKEFGKTAKKTEFLGDMSAFQTMPAVTMRQRSMQSIQRSFLNARRSLGNEAQYYHMPQSYSQPNHPGIWGM